MQDTNRSGEGGGRACLSDTGPELRIGRREKKEGEDDKWDGEKKQDVRTSSVLSLFLGHTRYGISSVLFLGHGISSGLFFFPHTVKIK